MIGKIIDINNTEAIVALRDGKTINIAVSNLPCNAKIGDKLNIDPPQMKMTAKNFVNISIPPIC
ncbi:hypothetical protein H2684_08945 [Clostridium sp. cel8]|jgi:hypothetical protein|uniref:hypothetical protein n=1 Tax=Clostridium sp. cel8 TaxID=2663123 RepID=UPI0015F3FD9B|nr:hypothetical protein [Clostridium sp. cel8]MBA5851431.1 hypothetical protein [Clostridium sp. cel8]